MRMAQSFEYAGNIHIHSRFSDGSGDAGLIARAGRRAGLDFLIITDHRNIDTRASRGWYGNLLLLVGEELGRETGHYLGLGIKNLCRADRPQKMIDEVARENGVGIIAHPHDIKLFWPDWHVSGYNGISLWNFSSQWRNALQNPLTWLLYSIHPSRCLTTPPPDTLKLWDSLQRPDRLITGVGSSDAHAFGIRPLGIPLVLVPYRLAFRAVNTHVLLAQALTGNVGNDEQSIIEAIRRGSCFVANDLRGPSRGFRFWATDGGRDWGMGESVPAPHPGLELRVTVPDRGEIVLMRDGVEYMRAGDADRLALVQPPSGIYRIEVYRDAARKWGWIYSNPLSVL